MDLPGTTYLLALATISITFAGFASIVVVFRQVSGGGIASYELFVIQGLLIRSFLIIVGALFPLMLSFFPLEPVTIWRISSAVAGVLQAGFVLSWRWRRRAVSEVPVTITAYVHNGLQLAAAVLLLVNSMGLLPYSEQGWFGVGLTAFLFLAGSGYLISMEMFLRALAKDKDA